MPRITRTSRPLSFTLSVGTIHFCFLFFGQALLNQLVTQHETTWIEPPQYQEQKWNPKLFRILSFGHLPVALDWLVVKATFDVGIGVVSQGTHPPLYYQFDLVTELDPAFYDVYEMGANFLAIARKDGQGAHDLLLKGKTFIETQLPQYTEDFNQRFWNRSWNIYVLLGYVNLFMLDDMRNASDVFIKASKIQGAPPYLTRLAKRLTQPGGEYEVGLKLIDFLMSSRKEDDPILEQLKQKKYYLTIAKYLFDLNQAYHHNKIRLPSHDPWGGLLHVNKQGVITTTTQYEKVFGLY